MFKKAIPTCLIAIAIACNSFAQKRIVWLDSDTANEMDDLYAITYLLKDPQIQVVGLSSAHFNNADMLVSDKWHYYPTKNINTVQLSQDLNEQLLQLTGRMDVPHPLGGRGTIGHAWGGKELVHSAAESGIIAAVHQLKAGEKLDVLCIGAASNLASAIQSDTTIISKIRVYLLAARYFSDRKVWDKSEFNVRNDLNAFDLLLNCKGLDLTVMPINTAIALKFDRTVCKDKLKDKGKLGELLYNRWDFVEAGQTWVMWDLALVMSYLDPTKAEKISAPVPPENDAREISVYKTIDAPKMQADFWDRMKGR
jgi:inosine-uridine nucleoside N-ribohydrolase